MLNYMRINKLISLMNPDYRHRWNRELMEVITLPDPPVGGQAGPNSGTKTRDVVRREE